MTGFWYKNFGRRIFLRLAAICVLGLTVGLGLAAPGAALAHADRLVAGKYGFRVGLLDEPAYQNLPNGVDLTICQGECHVLTDGSGNYVNPITDTSVYETLGVEVLFGGAKMPLKLTPVFRRPGKFSATFVPTAVGEYSLRFVGTIGPDKIDETFNPSKDGFDPVQDIKTIQFPDKIGLGAPAVSPIAIPTVPVPTTAASTASVAATTSISNPNSTLAPTPPLATASTVAVTASLNSEVQNQLAASNQQLQAARQEVAEAKNSASAATTFAIIGIIVGLVGVLAAVLAIVRSGRSGQPEAG